MFFQTIILASCLLSVANASENLISRSMEDVSPVRVDVLPTQVFTPMGFDDNDNVQIVLDGELPDSCYKLGPAQFRVDSRNHRISVRQQAFYYPGGWCADVRAPYSTTVDLGILESGTYDVVIQSAKTPARSYATLPIAVASKQTPDDYLYAPVSSVVLERESEQERSPHLVLKGIFTDSCMYFKQSRVNVRSNNVIEVLPIMEMDRVGCSQVVNPFDLNVSLDQVRTGRYLVHVRTMNGKSINQMIDL